MNNPSIQTEFHPDDPILTAYALGEIENPEQIKIIENALAADPALRETVDNARLVDSELAGLFAAEEKPPVPAYIESSLQAWPMKREAAKKSRKWQWFFWTAPTLAAACLIAMLGLPVINSSLDKAQQAERKTEKRLADAASASELFVADVEISGLKKDASAPTPPAPLAEPMEKIAEIPAPSAPVSRRENEADLMASSDSLTVAGNVRALGLSAGETKPKRVLLDQTSISLASKPEPSRERVSGSRADRDDRYSFSLKEENKEGHDSFRQASEKWNREGYDHIEENDFTSPRVEPLSTFSIDVDTASYANMRRMLRGGQLPPAGAVRIEELINYFDYHYKAPDKKDKHPLAIHLEGAPAPWNRDHQLVRIALQARTLDWEKRPASNLVFLLDVSGSMNSTNKLGLVKEAMSMLVERLDERDRVAIVVYAGSSGLVLDSTAADRHEEILGALERLKAGGSTNGGAGIELAYQIAQDNFLKKGNNRVILCTDGDFNVGVSDRSRLTDLVGEKAKEGVFLTVLGFGMGNYKDDMLETLSNKGNGNYGYIDSRREARKVFVEEAAGTLLTVAKDVKFQIEFNPEEVQAYRLIGYENRRLAAQDFNDDSKDAGEVGAGHSVTALYEIVPHGVEIDLPEIDKLKYSKATGSGKTADLLTVKMRYKLPDGDTSTKLEVPLKRSALADEVAEASESFRFASAVAEFGMVLRGSSYLGDGSLSAALARAKKSTGEDEKGYRHEFITLVHTALELIEH